MAVDAQAGKPQIDLASYELRVYGKRVRLERQPLDLLIHLVHRKGQLVTRQEIVDKLWGKDVFVDVDGGINAAIRKIRSALKDDPASPAYLETVVGKGYRFIGEVEIVSDPSAPAAEAKAEPPATTAPPKTTKARTAAVAAVIVVAAALAAFGLQRWISRGRSTPPVIHSIAVLPLENLSADKEQEYFADGMTEELITDLGKISALRVISRTSAMQYKGAKKPLPQIARELNVDAILEGAVLRSGNQVRITAQLIDASTDKHLWAESYEGSAEDVLALQSEVAQAVAAQIQIKMTPEEQNRLQAAPPVNPAAHDALVLGRYHLDKGTKEELEKARGYFSQALQIKPAYAAAYLGIGESYLAESPMYLAPRESMPPASMALLKSLELDDNVGEAHGALGSVRLAYDWDWTRAAREIARALDLEANSAETHETKAAFHVALGQHDEAAQELSRAQQLDPLSVGSENIADYAWILYMNGDYDAAAEQCHKDLDLSPQYGFARSILGLIALERGQGSQALAEARAGLALDPNPFDLEILGAIEAGLGKRREASAVLAELQRRSSKEYVCAYELGVIYAALDQKDAAFRSLNKACDDRDICMIWLRADPRLKALHADPRFDSLIRRVGFPSKQR